MMPSKEQEVLAMDSTIDVVDGDWIVAQIRDSHGGTTCPIFLDCRGAEDYQRGRIRGALSVVLPPSAIMLRRYADGKLSVSNALMKEQRDWFEEHYKSRTIVLYDSTCSERDPWLRVLFQRLVQDGCQCVYLRGGYDEFSVSFPEWCEGNEEVPAIHLDATQATLRFENLRLSPGAFSLKKTGFSSDSSDSDRCDSGLARDDPSPSDAPFPVEILPHLFLGNADNSIDKESLRRHNISYIINVTQNLPNAFQEDDSIKYMKIPIDDHWSQNLHFYFKEAIEFIEEARAKEQGVLVHCLAGISRSVTITLAYLMQKHGMTLNDAHEFVRQRKANIAPNFNFMGQLMDFQKTLRRAEPCISCDESCTCRATRLHFMTPTRTTPDSGINFDSAPWPDNIGTQH